VCRGIGNEPVLTPWAPPNRITFYFTCYGTYPAAPHVSQVSADSIPYPFLSLQAVGEILARHASPPWICWCLCDHFEILTRPPQAGGSNMTRKTLWLKQQYPCVMNAFSGFPNKSHSVYRAGVSHDSSGHQWQLKQNTHFLACLPQLPTLHWGKEPVLLLLILLLVLNEQYAWLRGNVCTHRGRKTLTLTPHVCEWGKVTGH
jgi:hypothetical protein